MITFIIRNCIDMVLKSQMRKEELQILEHDVSQKRKLLNQIRKHNKTWYKPDGSEDYGIARIKAVSTSLEIKNANNKINRLKQIMADDNLKNFSKRLAKNFLINIMPPMFKDVYYYATYGIVENFIWMHPSVGLLTGNWVEKRYSAKVLLGYYHINKYPRAAITYTTHNNVYKRRIQAWKTKLDIEMDECYRAAFEDWVDFNNKLNSVDWDHVGTHTRRLYTGRENGEKTYEDFVFDKLKRHKFPKPPSDHFWAQMFGMELKSMMREKPSAELQEAIKAWMEESFPDRVRELLVEKIKGWSEHATGNLKINSMWFLGKIIKWKPLSPQTGNFGFEATYNFETKRFTLLIRSGFFKPSQKNNWGFFHSPYVWNMSYNLFLRAFSTTDFGKWYWANMVPRRRTMKVKVKKRNTHKKK